MEEQKYVSGEQYRAMQQQPLSQGRTKFGKRIILACVSVAVLVVVFVAGWYSGQQRQKDHDNKLLSAAADSSQVISNNTMGSALCVSGSTCSNQAGATMSAGGAVAGSGPSSCAAVEENGAVQQLCGGSPISGTVISVSATSITVEPSSGGIETLSITSKTSIQDNNQPVTYSDIKRGDTVVIIPASGDVSQAVGIMINPKMTESSNGGPVTTGN